MRIIRACLGVLFVVFATTGGVVFAQQVDWSGFDTTKLVSIQGVVAKRVMQPDANQQHTLVHITVTGQAGQKQEVLAELPPMTMMLRRGATIGQFREGSPIEVEGYKSKSPKDGHDLIRVTRMANAAGFGPPQ